MSQCRELSKPYTPHPHFARNKTTRMHTLPEGSDGITISWNGAIGQEPSNGMQESGRVDPSRTAEIPAT